MQSCKINLKNANFSDFISIARASAKIARSSFLRSPKKIERRERKEPLHIDFCKATCTPDIVIPVI